MPLPRDRRVVPRLLRALTPGWNLSKLASCGGEIEWEGSVVPKKVPKKAVLGSKRLVGLDPLGWSRWVTGLAVSRCELVNAGFQFLAREGDVLVQAASPDTGNFLIANEIQLRYRANVPRRVRAHAALAEEKYDLPVYPVLVVLLPSSETVPRQFESVAGGLTARQDFRVIQLWEVDVALAFELASLLPLAPLMRGGGDEAVIERAAVQLRSDDDAAELESLLALFASFVLSPEVLSPERISELLRWDMAVLKESPLFQQAIDEGIEIGEQRGIRIGEQRVRAIATKMLQSGMPPEQVVRFTDLPLTELQQLLERAD